MCLRNHLVAAAIIELALLAGTGAVPAFASGAIDSGSIPNNSIPPEGVVTPNNNSQQSPNTEVTDQGSTPNNFIPPEGVGTLNNNSQPAPNIKHQPRLPLGMPYWLKGNICREQGIDMVCLTPQTANKLRWLTPSSVRQSSQSSDYKDGG